MRSSHKYSMGQTMVSDNHGRNDQLGDPCLVLPRDRGEMRRDAGTWRNSVESGLDVQSSEIAPQCRLVRRGTLTVGDEWEGIIYSLVQIIAPFGSELENSF